MSTQSEASPWTYKLGLCALSLLILIFFRYIISPSSEGIVLIMLGPRHMALHRKSSIRYSPRRHWLYGIKKNGHVDYQSMRDERHEVAVGHHSVPIDGAVTQDDVKKVVKGA